jgi:hypothetical protein
MYEQQHDAAGVKSGGEALRGLQMTRLFTLTVTTCIAGFAGGVGADPSLSRIRLYDRTERGDDRRAVSDKPLRRR